MSLASKRAAAAAEVLLIFPAALFMTSLFFRNLQPPQYEPARTAARIVDWYAARTHLGLWVFLIALPLAVLGIGTAMLGKNWGSDAELREAARRTAATLRAHCSTLLIGAATLAAAGVLAIVALHMLTD